MEDNIRDLQEDGPAGAEFFGFGWGLPEAVDCACYRPIDCAAPQRSARGGAELSNGPLQSARRAEIRGKAPAQRPLEAQRRAQRLDFDG